MPAEAEEIFPPRFGNNQASHRDGKLFSEANLSAFVPEDFEEKDESEAIEWDVFAIEEDASEEDDYETDAAPQKPEDNLGAQHALLFGPFMCRSVRNERSPSSQGRQAAFMDPFTQNEERRDDSGEGDAGLRFAIESDLALLLCDPNVPCYRCGARPRSANLYREQVHDYGVKEEIGSGDPAQKLVPQRSQPSPWPLRRRGIGCGSVLRSRTGIGPRRAGGPLVDSCRGRRRRAWS
jgi:hypothetical protein